MMRKRCGAVVTALLVALLVWAPVASAAPAVPPVTNVVVNKHTVFGDLVVKFVTVTLPAVYLGASLTPDMLQMTNILFVDTAMTSGGYLTRWSGIDSTLRVYATTGGAGTATFTGTPFTPTGAISTPTFTVTDASVAAGHPLFLGGTAASSNVVDPNLVGNLTLTTGSPVGTPSFTGDPVTPMGTVALTGIGGATAEVAPGTNLATETVELIVFGVGM